MDEALVSAALFQGVGRQDGEALVEALTFSDHKRRETVFAAGEPGDSLLIVIAGQVKVARRTADGRESLLAIAGRSDMFGELALFDPGPRTITATALTDTRLASLGHAALRLWLTGRPEIAEQLLRVLARRLRRTNDALADLVFTDVPGRVAKGLLALAERFGGQELGGVRVRHGLTQEELAQLVGASRETVNKALADFAGRGWLHVHPRAVTILDADRLAQRAGQTHRSTRMYTSAGAHQRR